MDNFCQAGRSCGFEGRWRRPCPEIGIHQIGSNATEPIRLCQKHFQEVMDAGLVDEPYIGDAEFQKRENQRKSMKN